MHRLYLVCILLMPTLFQPTLTAQWNPLQTSGLSGTLSDIASYGLDNVAVTGLDGMFFSTDGGQNWAAPLFVSQPADAQVYTASRLEAVEVYFDNIYAVGEDTVNHQGVVFGGQGTDWKLIYTTAVGERLMDINERNGVIHAVGTSGTVLRINDFTGAVSQQASGTSNDLYTVSGSYAGGENVLLKANSNSVNATWVVQNQSHTITHLAVGTGLPWAIRDSGAVHEFLNVPGLNQRPVYHRYPGYLNLPSPKATCTTPLLIGTENGIFTYSTIRCAEFQPSSLGYHIVSLNFSSSALGYALTKSGTILKTVNGGGDRVPFVQFVGPTGTCLDSTAVFEILCGSGAGNTWDWTINGQANNAWLNLTYTFDSAGTYAVELIGDNGTLQDTFSQTVVVRDTPSINVTYTVSDTLFCKIGTATVDVHNTDPNLVYSLYSLTDQSYKGSSFGNNGTVSLSTFQMVDSTYMLISVSWPNSDCERFLPDTLFFHVETPEASMHVDLTNALPGETVRHFNLSRETVSYQWNFGPNASMTTSSQMNPGSLSYAQFGLQMTELIATTINGCSDTLMDTAVYVYDTTGMAPCFGLNFLGDDAPVFGQDFLRAVAMDSLDNIYIAGSYANCVFQSKTGLDHGFQDTTGVFIAKYDRYGVQKWLNTIKTDIPYNTSFSNLDRAGISDIKVAPDGSIYTVGVILDDSEIGSNNWGSIAA